MFYGGFMEINKEQLIMMLESLKPWSKSSYNSEFEAGREDGYYSAVVDIIKLIKEVK